MTGEASTTRPIAPATCGTARDIPITFITPCEKEFGTLLPFHMLCTELTGPLHL